MRATFAVASLITACSTTPQTVAASQACHLDRVTQLPMAPNTPFAIVPARLDGQDVSLMLNTGAQRLAVRYQSRAALRLPEDSMHRSTVNSIGGSSSNNDAIVQRFEIGDIEMPQTRAVVIDLQIPDMIVPGLAGQIGGDIMAGYDMEFDFAKRHVSLWLRTDCDVIAPAWTGNWSTAILERGRGNLVTLPVILNGQSVRALLDTGARTTMLNLEATGRLGMTASTLAAARLVVERGSDGNDVFTNVMRLRDVSIGNIHSSDMRVLVGPMKLPFADMMLGVDFLQHHDLWISYAGQRAFIQ